MGIYLVGATLIHELLGRIGRRRGTRLFARTGKAYAVLSGLGAIYVASDAYVLEQASRAYPAGGRWFGILVGVILVLGSMLLVRRSGRDDFVSRPGSRAALRVLGASLLGEDRCLELGGSGLLGVGQRRGWRSDGYRGCSRCDSGRRAGGRPLKRPPLARSRGDAASGAFGHDL
jgi:hypothetical protein